ncbi:hypothetical protein JTB14_018101 [Gonioctena quinquepunctata]|nr:hypothetical protein JTB14_018101 [Gonioctena quinquepunctata]
MTRRCRSLHRLPHIKIRKNTSQVKTAILQATQVENMRNMQQLKPNHIKESNNEEDEGWEKARGQHRRKRRFLVGQSDQFSEIQTVCITAHNKTETRYKTRGLGENLKTKSSGGQM